jgi:hypothetical protein
MSDESVKKIPIIDLEELYRLIFNRSKREISSN